MKKIYLFLFLSISLFIYSEDELTKRIEKLELIVDDIKQSKESESSIINKNMVSQQKDQWGEGFSFEIFGGMHGIYSRGGLGINTPKIKNMISFGFGFVFNSFMINNYYTDNGKIFEVNSIVPAGYINFKWSSPLLFNFTRIYGVFEITGGYNISNYNIGRNLAMSFSSFGGIEFYTMKHISLYIEAGGGYYRTFTFEDNKYLNENNWLGSGFGLKLGSRFYIK